MIHTQQFLLVLPHFLVLVLFSLQDLLGEEEAYESEDENNEDEDKKKTGEGDWLAIEEHAEDYC